MKYEKPPLSVGDQIALLESRGLLIGDREKTEHYLSAISYYRLSAYTYPFRVAGSDNFTDGSSFDEVLDRYVFDRELRLLVFDAIERVEIAFRTSIIYHASMAHGAFWYEDKNQFLDQGQFALCLEKIDAELENSKETFIGHFNKKYGEGRPPSWMTIEVCPFGLISKMMQNLKDYSVRNTIAVGFGISPVKLQLFEGWITCLVYVRNICAHHSRLWNRTLTNKPGILEKASNPWIYTTGIDNRKVYYLLSVIMYLLQRINPGTSFRERLRELLAKHPDVPMREMGFPDRWEQQPLWSV